LPKHTLLQKSRSITGTYLGAEAQVCGNKAHEPVAGTY
jgi:hypothetical protein